LTDSIWEKFFDQEKKEWNAKEQPSEIRDVAAGMHVAIEIKVFKEERGRDDDMGLKKHEPDDSIGS